jgi:AcrR family transcriptional regulator
MVVYSHFGGVPELTRAVIDHGFIALETAFGEVAITDDPVADLAALALTCRTVARQSPHLYDLMFGLSTRATYRPLTPCHVTRRGTSPAFRDTYGRIHAACARLVDSGRVTEHSAEAIAAQLWSLVHGFITLELAGTFADTADPVREVLIPLGVNLAVGLGDSRERASQSHEAAAAQYQ